MSKKLRVAAGPVVLCLAMLGFAGPAAAQDTPRVPPQNAMKLSEIVAKVEQRSGFRYISEIEWEDGGYSVTYFTGDNAKVEIDFDPVTGESRPYR